MCRFPLERDASVEIAEKHLTSNRWDMAEFVSTQFDIRIKAVIERTSHGQSASRIELEKATSAVAPFFLSFESVAEQRIDRVLDRLSRLPWRLRDGGGFDIDGSQDIFDRF